MWSLTTTRWSYPCAGWLSSHIREQKLPCSECMSPRPQPQGVDTLLPPLNRLKVHPHQNIFSFGKRNYCISVPTVRDRYEENSKPREWVPCTGSERAVLVRPVIFLGLFRSRESQVWMAGMAFLPIFMCLISLERWETRLCSVPSMLKPCCPLNCETLAIYLPWIIPFHICITE